MKSNQDWNAAMSSEIFREYVNNELQKEAAKEQDDLKTIREYIAGEIRKEAFVIKNEEKEIDEKASVLAEIEKFEKIIKNNAELFEKFKMAKRALIENPGLVDKVDSNFVRGIMMLDLGE